MFISVIKYLQKFIEISTTYFIVYIYDQTMHVERTILISTDDDSVNNSTQDCPFVQVHHDHDISSNLHNKKNKEITMILTPMKTMMVILKPMKRKCTSLQTNKMSIPLPQFLQSVLELNIACVYPYVAWCLLEANFFNGYRDGDRVFYILATDSKTNFQFVDDEVHESWSPN